MKNTRIALIPAYQPEPMLLTLLCEVKKSGFEAVVVNDGSSGEAAELFKRAEEYAVVLTHTENRGKGAAIKTGLSYIHKHYLSGYVVVTLDADGQHRISDAVKICEKAEENPDTLILGSRGLNNNVPLRSHIGNAITRIVYRLSTGLKLYDTQTGLRAFGSRLVPEFLSISGERYEYEMNVLLQCARQNIPIKEVEIETVYFNNNSASHFNTVSDSYRVYKEIIKFSASSFVSFLTDYALYSLLIIITSGLPGTASVALSNICARIVSSSVNFTINRRLVFKSQNSVAKSALQYFALAALILAGNTLTLSFLTAVVGINQYVAKLCTEIIFFVISWLAQKYFIFRRKENV